MSQATKLSFQAALALLVAVAGASVQAQSIGDYSRAQRAVLEAEMARNRAKAMGVTVPSAPATSPPMGSPAAMPAPPLPSATATPAPARPPAAPREGMHVAGVITLTSRSMVELQNDGETHLLQLGDPVPGTAWVVSSIDAQRVVLKTSRSKTRTLPVPSGGR